MPAQPEDARRVIANARAALDFAREAGVPVIHVILVYRRIPGLGSEGMVSPFWRALHAAMGEKDRLTPGATAPCASTTSKARPAPRSYPS